MISSVMCVRVRACVCVRACACVCVCACVCLHPRFRVERRKSFFGPYYSQSGAQTQAIASSLKRSDSGVHFFKLSVMLRYMSTYHYHDNIESGWSTCRLTILSILLGHIFQFRLFNLRSTITRCVTVTVFLGDPQ